MSLTKKIAFALVPVGFLLLGGELLARVLLPAAGVAVHREHERLIDVLGLPALNQTMEFDRDLFWRLKPELRDFRVAGQLRESGFDFRVSTHAGLRSPPLPAQKTGIRILALGDSCTFGLGVDDAATWPAQLERRLRADGLAAEVVNAGVPGYTAFQGARLFERRAEEIDPDWVVASFGFNDRDLWASHSDPQTARDLAARRWVEVLLNSRLYALLRQTLRPAASPEAGSETSAEPTAAPRVLTPRLSPPEFEAALEQIRALAEARGARLLLASWPYRNQVEQGNRGDIHYQVFLAAFALRSGIPLVRLAPRFIDADRTLFIDHVHANAQGNRIAADAIAEEIHRRQRGGA